MTTTEPESPAAARTSISGRIPSLEAFAVNYPGYPSSPSRAVQTLGGFSAISDARGSSGRLELRFRPEDPFCHPVSSEPARSATGLLLRLARKKSDGRLDADIVARVRETYEFDSMVDYQHVVAMHAAQSKKRKNGDLVESETDDGVMMIVPKLFSIKNKPTSVALLPPSNEASRSKSHRSFVAQRWEMDIGPAVALPSHIKEVPATVNWEDHLSMGTEEWEWQAAVCKLFEERPIWLRRSIHERLIDDGFQISENQIKRVLFRAGYYFSTGPFGKLWIRRGYDPRKDPESRIYQRIDFRLPHELREVLCSKKEASSDREWKKVCRFEVPPSTFVMLQLFELSDDFIQEQIRKPICPKVFSNATGWFSENVLYMLRLQITVRFLPLYSHHLVKEVLRTKCDKLERLKQKISLQTVAPNDAPSDANYESAENFEFENDDGNDVVKNVESEDEDDLDGLKNDESEGEDDHDSAKGVESEEVDEKDEELDEYNSPSLAEGVNRAFDGSNISENFIHNDYLQDLLRNFPLTKGGLSGTGGHPNDPDNEEFSIYEQSSDDDDEEDN